MATGKCGLTDGSKVGDWRLPNQKELKSLINRQQENPAKWLNSQGFTSVAEGYSWYWSSSTRAFSTDSAWGVYMSYGYVDYGGKVNGGYVWPVRSGQ